MAKRKKVRSKPETASVEKPVVKSHTEDPWCWLEGLHPLGFWQPLYNFRKDDMPRARGTLHNIQRREVLPKELVEYEDFRLNSGDLDAWEFDPEPEVRARYQEYANQRPLRRPQTPSEDEGHALQPVRSSNGSESPTGPRKLCRETQDEGHGGICIRRTDHNGRHKDADGNRW